ncbi:MULTISPECIES: hypothetical protein [Lelliottia]|uniref:Uncharacterized protein n=1 Tax=Lelliottia aquatilis TaxID=2080838 RepID=A0ABX5A3A2_9ENTR|nr:MULTISPECIES: hypothetical protein [Lelliottia]POZ24117.1 hypothetical protein C3712_07855 [Lelliottia aquatilis]POZ27482.1 hypothetical protein C3708_07800 [Lelliottia sp. 7254-16]POZ29753.1 hypothetical protein C3711_01010 [Lelliottia aquatilis]POZ35318.1 hypothetical protein C3710_01010 [Lelliottia aquatilis]POZ38879.1 hypothetical protein C3709_07795 [Lelliottia aquatilis]
MDFYLKVELATVEEMEAIRVALLRQHVDTPLSPELLQQVAEEARQHINQLTVVELVPYHA